ncbi:general transcription factor IIIAa [Clarias gariepinus]|uniref:general transcription factor IIIAa n=1 Tax=Clarias gariepinus TaxID=13013 RepID=UPI00234D545D|nr:general transcription factor IIIAa [Clarias gariepinus]
MREMNTTSSGMFICSFSECQASYDKEWKLQAHLCKHTGVRPFECVYAGCSKTFCSKSHLTRHELTHTGEKPFSCSEDGCTQSFTTNFNLRKHISRKHKQEVKLYTCLFEGCDRSFKKNNLLKTHESTHTLQLPYECSYKGCDRRFVNPSKRKRHEKVHTGYTCPDEDCTFVAKNWTELTKHRKEHRVRVQCDVCKKVFRDGWFLKQHQRVHSEARLVFLCPRDGCTRSYTTAFNLQSHILSFHEQERAFSCTHPDCTKTFSMKQSLQRHSVVHDPERKKQKKPRPTRSLASHLSGYKTPNKRQTETRETNHVSSQSDSGSSEPVMSSEPEVHAGVTNLSVSDDLMASESSVVLVLEPLVLEDSQSEINSQSEIIKSHNIPESSQSEFLNIVTVQSEFKQTLDIVVTGH